MTETYFWLSHVFLRTRSSWSERCRGDSDGRRTQVLGEFQPAGYMTSSYRRHNTKQAEILSSRLFCESTNLKRTRDISCPSDAFWLNARHRSTPSPAPSLRNCRTKTCSELCVCQQDAEPFIFLPSFTLRTKRINIQMRVLLQFLLAYHSIFVKLVNKKIDFVCP